MRVRLLFSLSCFSMLTLAGTASGHVDLTYPPARLLGSDNADQLKEAPCGQSSNMRTANVTPFTPGQMVDITIEEYVDHTGYYAVSFDNDGDNDFPYPRANSDMVDPATDNPKTLMPIGDKVLGYHLDAEMNCADQPSRECVIKVQIPNVNCQNCTLQVVQFMYDKTDDQAPNEHYFQCADITIAGALMPGGGTGGMGGATGGGGAGGTGGAAGGSAGGASGGTPTGGLPAGGMAGMSTGGVPTTAGTAAAGTSPGGGAAVDDGGCAVARALGRDRSGLAAAATGLLLGLGWLARRRQRRS